MRVAITGATGFIGSRLVLRHVAAGDSVRLLSRRPGSETGLPDAAKVHSGDLVSVCPAVLSHFVEGADVVYHCAGEVSRVSQMQALHIGGTRRLIQAANGNIGHWVQLSSVGAYGPYRQSTVTEETPLRPFGIYETSKADSDKLVEDAAGRGAFSCTIVRPSIVFGPGMQNRSLFQLAAMIKRGLFFFIGPKGASANYIAVDNLVEALVRCGRVPAARGRVYNLSDHRSMEEFMGAIADVIGRPCPRLRLPEGPARLAARTLGKVLGLPLTESRVDALTTRVLYPAARIERELGYAHSVTIEDALFGLVGCGRAST